MAEVWRTAREWAADGLPGVPGTERGVGLRADRDAWPFRDRKGRGGGREYPLSALPLEARIAWAKRNFSIAETMVREETAPAPAPIAGTPGLARDARLALVQAADRFRQEATGRPLSVVAADAMFAGLYNTGRLDIPEWVRGAVGRLSPSSIARWRREVRAGRPGALAVDKAANRKGKSVIETAMDGQLATAILGLISKRPGISAKQVRAILVGEYGLEIPDRNGTLVPMPPVRTMQWHMARLREEHEQALLKITNPDAWKSAYRVSS